MLAVGEDTSPAQVILEHNAQNINHDFKKGEAKTRSTVVVLRLMRGSDMKD
jgi:hypothetical protein